MESLIATHASTALGLRAVAQATDRTRRRFHEWLVRLGTALGASPPFRWWDRCPVSGPEGPVLIRCPCRWGCWVCAFEGRGKPASIPPTELVVYWVNRIDPMIDAIWLKAVIRLVESLAMKACDEDEAQLANRFVPCVSIGSELTLKPIV